MATDLHSPLPRSATDLFGDPIDDAHPLWLNPSKFSDPEFDPESYISDLRTFVPFDTLRSELRSHLGALKHELVELINRDYADFVSLSTKLVDVDGVVVRMRAPLLEIKEKILSFRGSVDSSLAALQSRLKQRAQANEAREVLELLLDTFHVVSKVEKLIKELPTVPADWPGSNINSAEKGQISNGISLQHAENGTNLRETQSMLLERIASEMNRLKFYITHAQNMPFIENMVKRIQNASLLLDTSLGHCFIDGLEHKDASVIYNCLRAYAATDNTNSAEEIFRSTIVAPFIKKVIPHRSSGTVGGFTGDDLEQDYERIKQHIEDDCKFLLEISSTENSGLHVFSFLANSIIKEVLSAIQKGKPGAFSPGRPTEFLKNYKSSLSFLEYLEGHCPSRSAVAKLREEPVYIEFTKQWNTGVYFSLRFQEIAGSLDSALTTTTLVPSPNLENSQSLVLKQSISLMDCLRSCWRDDVLLLSCSDKFLRLFLQLLSRYSNWLSAGLSARKDGNAAATSGSEWATSASPDDFLYIIHDLNNLVEEVRSDYLDHVLGLLKSCSAEVLDLVKQSILQGSDSLKVLQTPVINSIVEALVERSVEDLRQLKGITATFRMTNKPLPVRHSPYVSGVLRPLKLFLEGEQAATYLTTEHREELLQGTASEITRRYYELASDLVSVARKTESSLQKIRLGAQRRAGASSDVSDNNISDTDKICMQLFLDIQEYGRNLALLGVDATSIPAYRSLWQCVAPSERQNTISF
ncbi:conserved oligomeric Golgi complex subunit 2-like [Salvia splendens]|uniref:conserved oligomeric Golgi complex subunit 2-like n=1 Tax=Salvia splendens TaxID=180675 RepID=UPI001C278461|nr:conserved oligomeric Golgi complex subunit 2-like [Salvia splendens]